MFEANALRFLAVQRGGRWSMVRAKHPQHEPFVQKALARLLRLGLIELSGAWVRVTITGKERCRGR